MPKILSRSGVSLADMYDVVGSIAGVEELDTQEVRVFHEMGGTLFSERLSGGVRFESPGALAQSTNWDVVMDLEFVSILRILGMQVFVSTLARTDFATVSVRDNEEGMEMPIWAWDSAVDQEIQARFEVNAATVGNKFLLRPNNPSAQMLPSFLLGNSQRQTIGQLVFRGRTTAFGAGTVTPQFVGFFIFAQLLGLSSFGVPIPSW